MSASAVTVQSLSKKYLIQRGRKVAYQTLRERLAGVFRWRGVDDEKREFWALKELSFSLAQGEVLGVIGRNGSGKSTLLKLISRITAPTNGRIIIEGRVASLLEVGTGFHPELTGRENIFLNGAILGMRKAEIAASFDEIVAFAEVDEFLDTPVKRYSSGMYVRLAFSVAAHLNPEILVVDEVLAVGDASFQAKCLGKMHEVAQKGGRTVLFVSHNLSAVRQLTTQCLVLDKGRAVHLGSPESAIENYLSSLEASGEDVEHQPREHECAGGARFVDLQFKSKPAAFVTGEPLEFSATVAISQALSKAFMSLTVFTQEGTPVGSGFSAACIDAPNGGVRTLAIGIPPVTLSPGRYHCTVALSSMAGGVAMTMDAVTSVLHFEILSGEQRGAEPIKWNPNWGALKLPRLTASMLP